MHLSDEELLRQNLRRFVRHGIVNDSQKKQLQKAGLIDFQHRMWGLTDKGVLEAERLGYL